MEALIEQPAEAAPVAKVEAPSEQAERGKPCLDGDHRFDAETDRCGRCLRLRNECWGDPIVEPAPQPPATTGGAKRLLGPADALRAEIVAALRKLAMYSDADTTPRHIAWQNLATELEKQP
jgi:hypothetical protein